MPEDAHGGAMRLRGIGVVRSPITDRKRMPVWGAPASVEIYPEFGGAMLHIEKHSHLWILGWLVQGREERDVLQVTPRGVEDRGPGGLHGVFAVRSPARPNPIGLTAARVAEREGLTLHLDRLDFLDGTPVIDIKPYFITRDLIFSANGKQVGRPRSREDLRESLLVQAVQFHGVLCPEVALGVRIIEHLRFHRFALNEPGEWHITAPLSRPVLIDALMGITRVTPGRGTLRFTGEDVVRFESLAEYRFEGALPGTASEVLEAPDEALFTAAFL